MLLISDNVSEYSRQRMRALQMSLRHYSNVDGRISVKELNLACQVSIFFTIISNLIFQEFRRLLIMMIKMTLTIDFSLLF